MMEADAKFVGFTMTGGDDDVDNDNDDLAEEENKNKVGDWRKDKMSSSSSSYWHPATASWRQFAGTQNDHLHPAQCLKDQNSQRLGEKDDDIKIYIENYWRAILCFIVIVIVIIKL